VPDVDEKHGVRQRVHVLDATERLLELLFLAPELEQLFLRELRGFGARVRRVRDLVEHLQALDRLLDRFEVGQHAAEPTLRDERHAATGRFRRHRVARGTLAADEQQRAAVGHEPAHELAGRLVERHRLLEVDDVDLVALAEDELGHLGIPETGLVPEVHTRFQHPAHSDVGHGLAPFGVNPPRVSTDDPVAGAPRRSIWRVCVVKFPRSRFASEARALYHTPLAANNVNPPT